MALQGREDSKRPPSRIIIVYATCLSHTYWHAPTLTDLLHDTQVLMSTADEVGSAGFNTRNIIVAI